LKIFLNDKFQILQILNL